MGVTEQEAIIAELQQYYREHPPADVGFEKLKLQAYALLSVESKQAGHNFWKHYSQPVEDLEIEKIKLRAIILRELDKERTRRVYTPDPPIISTNLDGVQIPAVRKRGRMVTVHSDLVPTDLFGKEVTPKERKKLQVTVEPIEYAKMRSGVITMFEKAECYGNPVDAISYWLNKRGRRTAFGNFIGFVYGEFPVPCAARAVRVMFAFTVKEPHIEARKAHRRNLKKRGIKGYVFRDDLKGNTLPDFESGKAAETTWRKKNPDEWDEIRIQRMKDRVDRREAKRAKAQP